MTEKIDRTIPVRVVVAVGIVIALAATLGTRLLSQPSGSGPLAITAPAARVPAPSPVDPATLDVPCWSCPVSKSWPVRFRTDLDLLAPLGDGPANAAKYFEEFYRPDGPRADEVEASRELYVEHPSVGRHLPFDHPLVLEAEPWVDQATMRFYPEVFEPRGYETQVPNLLHMIALARTWAARGLSANDPDAALADFRRAIRLGRLLRQEDAVVINDLVGLACIHIGTRTMFEWARERGDRDLTLLSSIVLGEVAPQRLRTMMDVNWPEDAIVDGVASGQPFRLHMSDRKVDQIIESAVEQPDRRFRLEAIGALGWIYHGGSDSQRARVKERLDELSASSDALAADMARWALEQPHDPDALGLPQER